MMTYAALQTFMEKLKQLINFSDIPSINHPEIISERPQLQLLYDELHNPIIQTLFIDQHQHLQKVNDLRKTFLDAAEEAQYIVDLFLSGVHIRNMGQVPTSEDFERSLDLDDVCGTLKSVVNLFLSCLHLRSNSHSSTSHNLNRSLKKNDVGNYERFPTSDHFNISLNLDDVMRSFESVKVELMSTRIDNMKMASSPRTERKPSQSSATPVSFTGNSKGSKKLMDEIVVGLDADLELIRNKLVENQKKLDVVSIVGMGGIGKTTLATKRYQACRKSVLNMPDLYCPLRKNKLSPTIPFFQPPVMDQRILR